MGPSSKINKIGLIFLSLFIVFYAFMDIQLYVRIQDYVIDYNYHVVNNSDMTIVIKEKEPNKNESFFDNIEINTKSVVPNLLILQEKNLLNKSKNISYDFDTNPNAFKSNYSKEQKSSGTNKKPQEKKYEDYTWISCEYNPLCHITAKAVLLDHTNLYLFAPLAILFDNVTGLSKSNFITANMISFFHVLIAIIAARCISSDHLQNRRIGVILFEIRTFLDDLDGLVARKKKNIHGELSEVGTSGYYIDGFCDMLGCIAMIIGIYIFLRNNRPRRGYSPLSAVLPVSYDGSHKEGNKSQTENGVVYRMKITNNKILKKVIILTLQLLFSSLAWNRYIATYQNLLGNDDSSPFDVFTQNKIFKSSMFFFIAWLWRLVNVHSLLHCVLISIFCDKLWEFLRTIQYSGILILIISMCITEVHILELQNYVSNNQIL